MTRLEDQDPEHQHVIVGWPAALGSVAPRHGALQVRPKHLEIDDRAQPFQVVALGRKLLQTFLDIEKSRPCPSNRLRFASPQRIKTSSTWPRFLKASNLQAIKPIGTAIRQTNLGCLRSGIIIGR